MILGNDLRKYFKEGKINFYGLLVAIGYIVVFIIGLIHGILSGPTGVFGATVLYQIILIPLAGILASIIIGMIDSKVKYIFPIICGLVDASYQYLILGIKNGELAEMDIFLYVSIYTFAPAFILSVIGFIVGLVIRNKITNDEAN